jgi:tetratricopeptide (TPR) repeat protein
VEALVPLNLKGNAYRWGRSGRFQGPVGPAWPGRSSEAERLLSGALGVALSIGGLGRARERDLAQAHLGRFVEAHRSYAHAKALEAEFGTMLHFGMIAFAEGRAELLADEAVAAERLSRAGYTRFGELGGTGFRTTSGALFADALLRLGRHTEAGEVLAEVEAFVARDDMDAPARLHVVRARVHHAWGGRAQAEQFAREAVALAAQSDHLELQGDALLALAEALGDGDEARGCLGDALDLFERKENLVQAQKARALHEKMTGA